MKAREEWESSGGETLSEMMRALWQLKSPLKPKQN